MFRWERRPGPASTIVGPLAASPISRISWSIGKSMNRVDYSRPSPVLITCACAPSIPTAPLRPTARTQRIDLPPKNYWPFTLGAVLVLILVYEPKLQPCPD